MAQERSIPGCPWAFADDMRGIIDKKEFRFVMNYHIDFIEFVVQTLQLVVCLLFDREN